MPSQLEVVYAGRAELAEGPVWHAGALWWVDIVAGTLNRLDPQTGINVTRATGSHLGAASPCTDGRWLLAQAHDCSLLDWETGRFTPLASPTVGMDASHRFNDGKCDPQGRFWTGTKWLGEGEGKASLYRIHPNGEVHRVRSGISMSNGLAWSPDGATFYHVDTPRRKIERFRFAGNTGALSEGVTHIQFADAEGWPDGMTCDAEGHLWVALWGGGSVVRVHGESGEIMSRLNLPVSNASSCTFGGSDLRTLFITTAWEGFAKEQRQKEPLAGSIFATRTDTCGQAVTLFAAGVRR